MTNPILDAIIGLSNEREVIDMFFIEVGVIGMCFILFFYVYFMLMLIYAIIAATYDLPMPLDDRYLLGRINEKIWLGSGIIGFILFII